MRIRPPTRDDEHERAQNEHDPDSREQVDTQVVEGQDTGIPEAILWHEHERDRGDGCESRQPDPGTNHHHQRQHDANAREHEEHFPSPHVGVRQLHSVDLVRPERQQVPPHLRPVDDRFLGVAARGVADSATDGSERSHELQPRPALWREFDAQLLPSHVVQERAASVEGDVPPHGGQRTAEPYG